MTPTEQAAQFDEALAEMERAGWPCRLVEAPAMIRALEQEVAALRAERDAFKEAALASQQVLIENGVTLAGLEHRVERLKGVLAEAVDLIRTWHGMTEPSDIEPGLWALYQQSPEMRRLSAALSAAPPVEPPADEGDAK